MINCISIAIKVDVIDLDGSACVNDLEIEGLIGSGFEVGETYDCVVIGYVAGVIEMGNCCVTYCAHDVNDLI